jgi:site-specific recombinase XerD
MSALEIPPTGVFVRSRNKLILYIFTPNDLRRLLDAAVECDRHQYYAVQHQRYAMLFGLIAATGLRVSEALDLRLGDILPDGVLHIRETKFRKSRLVPLHASVRDALARYVALRRDFVGLVDCLFLSARGRRLSYPVVNKAFREIIRHADVAPGRAWRPRIHDLRHTFATRVLEQCGAGRAAIARHAVALMTYLGHSDLRYTYWYLQATPELDDRNRHRGRGVGRGRSMTRLAPLITGFVRDYMPGQRGYSPHTCEAYAHSFRLLFAFAAKRTGTTPSQLHIEQLDARLILDFLEHIERERRNGAVTRNLSLSAIKAFNMTVSPRASASPIMRPHV